MHSIWSDSVNLPTFESLKEDIHTDVLIIGGGITGILCAYYLAQAGINYTLVEANTICSGITKNTTAKITSQHGLLYHQILHKLGAEKTRLYLEANETALHEYEMLCSHINCDFAHKDSYVYSLSSPDKLEKEMNALDKIGYSAQYCDTLTLPFETKGAVKFPHQAQFHPLKFITEISKHLHIYEHTKVQEIVPGAALTPNGRISASKIIVTTHFPIFNKHGFYFLKMYQDRSYVLALKNAPNVDGMFVDEDSHGLSFRNYKDTLLLGGGGHRTGEHGGNWKELSQFAQNYYPQSQELFRWATQDCMTLDGIPYIGPYAKNTPNCFVATGFQKWGMSTAMVAALILRDCILEKKNPYASVFSPARSIWHPQLFTNIWESTKNLLRFSPKRCPHMGCALNWNPEEHSWDCPCHGSRFDEDGQLIDNPATDDLQDISQNTNNS